MKTILFIFLSVLLLFACQNAGKNKKAEKVEPLTTFTYKVTIEGMTCTGCEETIKGSVAELDGIQSVEASHSEGYAIVVFDPLKADTALINNQINSTDYLLTGVESYVETVN